MQGLEKRSQINDILDSLHQSGIEEEDLTDLIDNDYFADLCEIFINGNDVTFYENVSEAGADSDNVLRDENEDDESFGRFLCEFYAEKARDTFYYECRDG